MKKKIDWFFLISLFIFIFLCYLNISAFQKGKEIRERAKILKAEIENLEKKKEELKKQILETEKETFWEEKAREQGYKKEGEEIYIIKFK